ncbi:hypothetical protein, partial [Candidatus Phytoplasma palmae]|uniref:hypothetical protein n=1 Tax=Candidatus Phytoplasma palmae TaxID=85624 RepID=UPI003990C39E
LIPIKFISIIIFSLILSINLFSLQRVFASSDELDFKDLELLEEFGDHIDNHIFIEKDKKISKIINIHDDSVPVEKKKKNSSKTHIKPDELKKIICNFIEKAVSENINQNNEKVKKGQELFISLENNAFQIENKNKEKLDLKNYNKNDSLNIRTKIFIDEKSNPNIENNYGIDYLELKHDKQKDENFSYRIHHNCNEPKEFFAMSETVFKTATPKIK